MGQWWPMRGGPALVASNRARTFFSRALWLPYEPNLGWCGSLECCRSYWPLGMPCESLLRLLRTSRHRLCFRWRSSLVCCYARQEPSVRAFPGCGSRLWSGRLMFRGEVWGGRYRNFQLRLGLCTKTSLRSTNDNGNGWHLWWVADRFSTSSENICVLNCTALSQDIRARGISPSPELPPATKYIQATPAVIHRAGLLCARRDGDSLFGIWVAAMEYGLGTKLLARLRSHDIVESDLSYATIATAANRVPIPANAARTKFNPFHRINAFLISLSLTPRSSALTPLPTWLPKSSSIRFTAGSM